MGSMRAAARPARDRRRAAGAPADRPPRRPRGDAPHAGGRRRRRPGRRGERAELDQLAGAVAAMPVLLLAEAEDPPRGSFDGDAALELELEPLDAAAVEAIAHAYGAGRASATVPVGALLEASRGLPEAVHEAAGEWAGRRRPTASRAAGRGGGRPHAAAHDGGRGRRGRGRPAAGARARRAADRARTARHLPVQGARDVRSRGRGVLLRSRAPRGRAGRAPGRRAAAGDRRRVGHRQVVRAARGPAARARAGDPAGER